MVVVWWLLWCGGSVVVVLAWGGSGWGELGVEKSKCCCIESIDKVIHLHRCS